MNVSELARLVGIAPSAVRFYERKGILPPAVRQENGYRDYTDDDLCRLRTIVGLRRLGLELPESGRLAELCQSGQCDLMARDLLPLVASQRTALARTRAELDDLDQRLAALENSLQSDDIDPDLCLTKGGDDHDAELRLRTRLSVPTGLPMLTNPPG
jgi:MerR family transcriptional regulator, copper efflux regulator